MSNFNQFPAPPANDVRPHVVAAIDYFGYFEPIALQFLTDVTVRYANDRRVVGSAVPDEIVGLTPKGDNDPLEALRLTVAQAYQWYWEDKEWQSTQRTKRFLPYMRIRFCPACPPAWAGKDIIVKVEELRGYPLRHCSLIRCEGSTQQGMKRLLEEGALVSVAGEL